MEEGSRTHSLTELDVGSSFPEKRVKALFMNTHVLDPVVRKKTGRPLMARVRC